MSGKHRRRWCDFVEVGDGMVYYPGSSLSQDKSAVIYECLEFGCVSGRDSWAKVEDFREEGLMY